MIQVKAVTADTVSDAATVHAASWRESHRAICSADFVAAHTTARQAEYLRREMESGKQIFMLTDEKPLGIVSVSGALIENLYVHPDAWRHGYGTVLLHHAEARCCGTPTLWVLSANGTALAFYRKNGYRETGARRFLREGLYEIELQKIKSKA